MPDRHRTLLASLVLAVFVLLAYGAAWRCDFVHYDDHSHVFENAHVTGGLSAENVRWAFTRFNGAQWIPLTWLSFMLDVTLFGLEPGAMHGVNVLLHTANTLLLFALLRTLTASFWRSLAVAALFGLHPVNVESVAWITERKNVLSTFFWLLATLAYVRHAKTPGIARMALVTVLLACGLMVKTMLVTLPFTLLLLDFWPLARTRPTGWLRLVLEKVPLFALSAVASSMQMRAAIHDGLLWPEEMAPLSYRLLNAFANVLQYLGTLAWPVNLAPMYPLPCTAPVVAGIGGAVAVVLLLAVCVASRKRMPALCVGILWFLGTQVPVSGLVGAGDAVRSDRYLYIPQIGVFIAAVWSIAALRVRWNPVILRPLAATAAILLGTMTFLQVGHWRDTATLLTHTVNVSPDSVVARGLAGWTFARIGRLDAARENYEAALALVPAAPDTHCSLGLVLARMGRLPDAIAQFRQALRYQPDHHIARLNLGTHLLAIGAVAESTMVLAEAVSLRPDDATARRWLDRARTAANSLVPPSSPPREIR
ncbi:MAG: tetratricopeptide repeat protein [Chthoniobacteraceae bacterium]